MSLTISRKTLGWAVPATAASAALIAALSMGTFGAFSASITNDPNTAGAGTINMRQVALDESLSEIPGTEITTVGAEGNAVTTETDLFGGNLEMNPGDIEQTIVNISHSGSLPANTFVLSPGVIEDGGTNLGNTMTVAIEASDGAGGWTAVQPATALNALPETIDAGDMDSVPQGEDGSIVWSDGITFRFTTTLPEDAPIGVMGASVSQPLTWTFDTASTN